MIGPSRPVPRVGGHARIRHFGGGIEPGVILAVRDEGVRLDVEGEDGKRYEFVLSPASARFVSAADAHGSRLEIVPVEDILDEHAGRLSSGGELGRAVRKLRGEWD
jgi:hypothetical protein